MALAYGAILITFQLVERDNGRQPTANDALAAILTYPSTPLSLLQLQARPTATLAKSSSALARTLSPARVARMSESEARATFRTLRRHATGGEPVRPSHGCLAIHEYRTRSLREREMYARQSSVASDATFRGRGITIHDHPLATATIASAVPGSASTTTSSAPTSASTWARWRGAKTTGRGTKVRFEAGGRGGAEPPEEPRLCGY